MIGGSKAFFFRSVIALLNDGGVIEFTIKFI
jgi:hypothetical protein